MRSCTVSFADAQGMRHSVEVTAETLLEAAALALHAFRQSELVPAALPNGGVLEIRIRPLAVSHAVTLQRVQAWLSSNGKSPREHALKVRLRHVLDSPS